MRLLCLFMAHNWTHMANVMMRDPTRNYRNFGPNDRITYKAPKRERAKLLGLYQCKRCKSLSKGVPQ